MPFASTNTMYDNPLISKFDLLFPVTAIQQLLSVNLRSIYNNARSEREDGKHEALQDNPQFLSFCVAGCVGTGLAAA